MTNNDIVRRIRYAMDISNPVMIDIFKHAGYDIAPATLVNLLRKEDDAGYLDCSGEMMCHFLDGLIIHKRGRKESASPVTPLSGELTNNIILKKLRIALDLNEDEMIAVMKLADIVISKSELSALFRNSGHKNYKVCGDQFLRNFLKGLTIRNRKSA